MASTQLEFSNVIDAAKFESSLAVVAWSETPIGEAQFTNNATLECSFNVTGGANCTDVEIDRFYFFRVSIAIFELL